MTKEETFMYLVTHAPKPPEWYKPAELSAGVAAWANKDSESKTKIVSEWQRAGAPDLLGPHEVSQPQRDIFNAIRWAERELGKAVFEQWPLAYAKLMVEAAYRGVAEL